MPLPSRRQNESRSSFVDRCIHDPVIEKEFGPNMKRKLAVCLNLANRVETDYSQIGPQGGESKVR